jgi:hypothetical protein
LSRETIPSRKNRRSAKGTEYEVRLYEYGEAVNVFSDVDEMEGTVGAQSIARLCQNLVN